MQFRLCPENSVAQNDGSSEQCIFLEEKEKKTVEVFEVVFTFLVSSIFRSRSILLTIFGSGNVHLVSL